MSKLHAQMALFGVIDEVVSKTNDLDVVETVEGFLPGLTGPGKRGWFGELTRFLAKPELAPRDPDGNPKSRSTEPMFPDFRAAVTELKVEERSGPPPPPPPEGSPPSPDEMTPTDVARSLFASTVLSKVLELQKDKDLPPIPGIEFPEAFDPLSELLPQNIRSLPPRSSLPGMDPIPAGTEPEVFLRNYIVEATNRDQFQMRLQTLAGNGVIDPAIAEAQIVCTGGLRKIDGQFCSVLTTDWQKTDLTVDDIKNVIEPHNWPMLCSDFFVRMEDQNPLLSRGWSRVLEVVSADPTQWELRTALRYWKGETTPGGGVYINYDLDKDRTGDCMMVEVDAGYLLITPLDDGNPAAGVRIQTCKQVRIRGMSSTASAALACFMGWGDVSSHMLTDRAKPPPATAIKFGNLSVDTGPQPGDGTNNALLADDKPTDAAIEAAAEETELPPGWRGALIGGAQQEVKGFIEVAACGASDLLKRWSDGMTAKDVEEFGTRFGREMTEYAAGMLNAAANAMKPQPEAPDTNGGG